MFPSADFSASPSFEELAAQLGIEFTCDTSDVPLNEDSPYRPATWCTIAKPTPLPHHLLNSLFIIFGLCVRLYAPRHVTPSVLPCLHVYYYDAAISESTIPLV
ncbi:unnamed protein product [Cyclocybe aegerita]|uniref:Uncharacterized protein n=1 Tax=Cyclocybe aegerita TaxID=1973307 RepID=A0A8S0X1B6_CYCAE|nr:unnamed protein product [Cyclocybe aegerita]